MNQVEQSVTEYVDEIWEDVVADIEQLVSYPSVAVAAHAEPVRRLAARSVMRSIVRSALRKSSATRRATTRAMWHRRHSRRGDKQLATICHVDVVPAGPGWNTDRLRWSAARAGCSVVA